tara:strand:- start:2160 stop:3722 length:1563 start_codon:yes stop_codon:yes gene_type:complete
MIKQALISVSDKTGLLDFAKNLVEMEIKLISTGGTAKLLLNNNIPVIQISDYTNFPEILSGRVKTLHPKIYGGILGRQNNKNDLETLILNEIPIIDLVIVNLYPFEKIISQKKFSNNEAIENIDIGGTSLLRAAAKNYENVTVICNPSDYANTLNEMKENEKIVSLDTRLNLAKKVFSYTSSYDTNIFNYLNSINQNKKSDNNKIFPETLVIKLNKNQDLRYGENPHQLASLYSSNFEKNNFFNYKQLQGKELSFNNLLDIDVAWNCVNSFEKEACVIVKHTNPCGVALAKTLKQAYLLAYETDPTSSFGSILAFNGNIDEDVATEIVSKFVEIIVAPSFDSNALKIFSKKEKLRVMLIPNKLNNNKFDLKYVNGGFLLQTSDSKKINFGDLKIVTKIKPNFQQMQDMLFSSIVAKFVKSNAIVFSKKGVTLGIGAGQTSRVDSVRIASQKVQNFGKSLKGSVVASDAFFPFRDGLDEIVSSGAIAVVQPGGSIRDDEVISAANEKNIIMAFTGVRNFKH